MFKPSTIKKIQEECQAVIAEGNWAIDYPEEQDSFRQTLRDLVERLEYELDESYFQSTLK
jgi:hypothetical protein